MPEVPGDYVSREMIEDGIMSKADLEAGCWEQDFITGSWHRRTPEFFEARNAAAEALVEQRKAAEVALAAALIELESGLPMQRDGLPCPIADNRQPYVAVGSEKRSEGEFWTGCKTSTEAIANWKAALRQYAAAQQGDTLWWRVRPEIRGDIAFGDTEARWIVYSRLAIGNRADTALARFEAGTEVPAWHAVAEGIATAEQLADLGWVRSEVMESYHRAVRKPDGWHVTFLSIFSLEPAEMGPFASKEDALAYADGSTTAVPLLPASETAGTPP